MIRSKERRNFVFHICYFLCQQFGFHPDFRIRRKLYSLRDLIICNEGVPITKISSIFRRWNYSIMFSQLLSPQNLQLRINSDLDRSPQLVPACALISNQNRSLAMFVASRCHSKLYKRTIVQTLLHTLCTHCAHIVQTLLHTLLHTLCCCTVEQFGKVLSLERCRLSAGRRLFVLDTKGLSMVAGEWRAVTLASEGWPGLVSWPTTSSPKLPVGQNCRFESRKLYLTPKKHG